MVACLAVACSSELPDVGEPASATLGFEPEAPADAVPPIVRLEVASTEANPSSMRLFQGELSDYYLGRIRSGELPETLLQREIPTLAFASDEGATVVPTQSLEEGVYALASPELGLIGAFNISAASSLPILRRLWPPAAEFGTYAAYCGSSVPTLAVEVTLEPSSVGALLSPGLGTDGLLADRCLRLELEQPLAEGALVLPPVVTGGATLEQAPLLGAVPIDARDPECGAGELALGPGCISVADDRLFLRSDRALLWLFHEPSEAVVVLETAGQRVM
ncbi:MAG TPA: hypothetical protein VGP93_13165, partial [Polyangiaceae bacterium]|nr:hypothetical protein [Polyangiaceae bacterium]